MLVGDYYFVKAGNDLVSLNIVDCDGKLTGSQETVPPPSTASVAVGPLTLPTNPADPAGGQRAANGAHDTVTRASATSLSALAAAPLLLALLL